MRKHVTPADPAATIPDPERGHPLPPKGRAVTWSAYWASLAMRKDVLVADAAEEVENEPALRGAVEPDAVAPAPSAAGVPFMITNAMRARLRDLGKTDEEIAVMTPTEADTVIAAAG